MSDRLTTRSPELSAVTDDYFSDLDWNDAQLQARAAWYYYIGGLTQQEIADKLGITRLRVNRIVGQARTDGLVHVDIQMPLASCVALEERIKERFNLIDVSIVPSVDNYESQTQVLGEAAGILLQSKLRDGISIGVSWGRSLRATIRRLKAARFNDSSVVALMGGMTRGLSSNTFEVCNELARTLGAECAYITAPIFCPSEHSRDSMMTHLGLSSVMRKGRECDIAMVACGNMSSQSLMMYHEVEPRQEAELRAMGAVGDILGTFIDGDGEIIDHPLNKCVMAVSPVHLKNMPHAVLVAGGMEKVDIIRAAIKGGYVNCLVTDESVAAALLATV